MSSCFPSRNNWCWELQQTRTYSTAWSDECFVYRYFLNEFVKHLKIYFLLSSNETKNQFSARIIAKPYFGDHHVEAGTLDHYWRINFWRHRCRRSRPSLWHANTPTKQGYFKELWCFLLHIVWMLCITESTNTTYFLRVHPKNRD